MVKFAFLLFLAAALGGANAFVAPAASRTHTQLFNKKDDTSTGWDSFKYARDLGEIKDIAYGEESRKFRRTVYSHDDWKKHRSADRFFFYIAAIFKSGVYKNLGRELTAVTAISTFVFAYNIIFGGYVDFAGVEHGAILASDIFPKTIGLPLTPFTLAGSSLGLLLVFRTNTSYQRWDEARKNWGMNINHTRDLVRLANAFYDSNGVSPEKRADDLNHVALCTWAFVRAMKRHLSPEEEDEEAFRTELYEKLPKQQAQMIIDAAHRPNRALQDLSYAVDALPMHFMRKNEIHRAITIFEDNLGSSERILTSPVPVFYSRHTARYVAVWLFLIPFALYEPFKFTWNHIGMIPAAAVLSTFLFGIEELATQLEEPFTILPMQAFCDKIYNWCMEIMTWSPGDAGRPMPPLKPEHAYFAAVAAPQSQPAAQQQVNGGYAPQQAAAPAQPTAAASNPAPASGDYLSQLSP